MGSPLPSVTWKVTQARLTPKVNLSLTACNAFTQDLPSTAHHLEIPIWEYDLPG